MIAHESNQANSTTPVESGRRGFLKASAGVAAGTAGPLAAPFVHAQPKVTLRFLNAGHYQPIAEAVARATLDGLPNEAACLDAGCGEGYYLRQLAAAATTANKTLAVLGLDISKWAVLAAARQDARPNWVVGTNARLPVLDGTVDRLLCLFGFPVYGEFARVLRPGGQLVQVDAGPDHLRELREIIYPTLKPQRPADSSAPDGFARLAEDGVRFALRLDSQEAIADLLAMTPHLYRASAEGRARAAALSELVLTVDVRIVRYARRPAGEISNELTTQSHRS